MKAKEETLRIVKRLRLLIYLLDLTQREVEQRAGFSRGYLTQLLHGTVDIKLWQLLAILDAIQIEPAEFFAELFPRRQHLALDALEDFHRDPQRPDKPLSRELARLCGLGIESIAEFRERLARCENTLSELERRGIVNGLESRPGKPLPPVPRGGAESE